MQYGVGKIALLLELRNLDPREAVAPLKQVKSSEPSLTELSPLEEFGLERQVIRLPAKQSCTSDLGRIKAFNIN